MSKILDTIKRIVRHPNNSEKIPSFTKNEWDDFMSEFEILVSPYHEYPNPMVSLNVDGAIWDVMFEISKDKTCVVITECWKRKEPEPLPFDEVRFTHET